ncbi:MAG TPA: CPBP family intramembrane glutamic endopeptidase [Propionicimonas sp.]|nr:CPBP family intramembrane glutamic endopeptidase [Propionicimonas sp.]
MTTQEPERVAWSRVGWYYGIAFGGAVLVGLSLWALHQAGLAMVLVQGGLALLYMPLPLVAGLIVERRAGRRPLIATEWRSLRTRFWSTIGRSAVYAVVVMLGVIALGFVAAFVAGALGVPGAGHFVAGDAEFRERLLQIVPVLPADVELPPVPVLAAGLLSQGLLAGVTINGLFAFGEEYGWRGVLADELRPLGNVRANLVTGVLWGLWHAPVIILLGHNYGTEWGWGVLLMVAWTTPLSFLLSWVRQRSGSVLAPAFLHGAYNGTIGVFALTIIGGSLFVSLPMGLLMALVLTIVAIVVWHLPERSRKVAEEPVTAAVTVPDERS